MENNFLSGGVGELEKAKAAIEENWRRQSELNKIEADVSSKEKALESQKKYVNDKANDLIKERRSALKKTHDEQVDVANKGFKEAEKKRKVAKNDAVSERISRETTDVVTDNNTLNAEIDTMLRENGMPKFCKSGWFYALFAPRRGGEFVIFILTVIITLGVIPNIVCALVKTDQWLIKALIYLAIVVFFVLIYFIIFLISKRNSKGHVLEEIRPKRDMIRKNNKEIKRRAKNIKGDKDESEYELSEYDSEIAANHDVLNEKMNARDEALKDFDENTAVQLREEIERENQPAIDEMTKELEESRAALSAAKEAAQKSAEEVTNSYEVFLGKKNTSVEKVDELIHIMQEGRASTIMEALDVLRGEIR